MELHIPNLNTLIAHLEAQPPERINMSYWSVKSHDCGCYIYHARLVWPVDGLDKLGLPDCAKPKLFNPPGWEGEASGVRRYPAHRVIATLKRLRDHYLATGEVVVDWGPEPGDEPAKPWAAPRATELALPATLTRFLDAAQPLASEPVE